MSSSRRSTLAIGAFLLAALSASSISPAWTPAAAALASAARITVSVNPGALARADDAGSGAREPVLRKGLLQEGKTASSGGAQKGDDAHGGPEQQNNDAASHSEQEIHLSSSQSSATSSQATVDFGHGDEEAVLPCVPEFAGGATPTEPAPRHDSGTRTVAGSSVQGAGRGADLDCGSRGSKRPRSESAPPTPGPGALSGTEQRLLQVAKKRKSERSRALSAATLQTSDEWFETTDDLHAHIRLPGVCGLFVNHFVFQRMRRIKQLSLSEL
jgi:hypothetical protein